MTTPTPHEQIMGLLGELKGSTKSGFDAVNRRLDTLNSKVAEHERKFGEAAVENAKNGLIVGGLKSKQDSRNKWLEWFLLALAGGALQLSVLVLLKTGVLNLDPDPQTPTEIKEALVEAEADVKKLETRVENMTDPKTIEFNGDHFQVSPMSN